MILPANLLILQMHFNVSITAEDYVRLGPSLRSWGHLNSLLILNQFPLEDLKKLLLLELAGAKRQQHLTKLRSRIVTAESKHIQLLISHALSGKKTGTETGVLLPHPPTLHPKVRKPRTPRRP